MQSSETPVVRPALPIVPPVPAGLSASILPGYAPVGFGTAAPSVPETAHSAPFSSYPEYTPTSPALAFAQSPDMAGYIQATSLSAVMGPSVASGTLGVAPAPETNIAMPPALPTHGRRQYRAAVNPATRSAPTSAAATRRSMRLAQRAEQSECSVTTKSEVAPPDVPIKEHSFKEALKKKAPPNSRIPKRRRNPEEEMPAKKRFRATATKIIIGKAKDDRKYEQTEEGEIQQEEEAEPVSCCICMSEPEREEVSSIDGCEHKFCFGCISQWADRENTCPLCKSRFFNISRLNKTRKKGGPPNTKTVKSRDQRSDTATLEAMLATIRANSSGAGVQYQMGGMSRLLLAVGQSSSVAQSYRARHGSSAHSQAATIFLDDFALEADDDSSDIALLPDNNFHSFMRRRLHAAVVGRPETALFGSTLFAAATSPGVASMAGAFSARTDPHAYLAYAQHHFHHHGHTARSYALNGDDANAGRTPEIPLEIDDDEDDDVVIVDPPSQNLG